MPVEVMARRGEDTLRYGPLKPRGLPDPKTGREPYAVVQLRKDNADGSIYNLVGFQTHLKWPEQRRVFTMIPALHDAQFLRYGVMHRNTYLDSPRLLDRYYRLRGEERISFAGQITGVEGYVESCASGFLVGVETARRLQGKAPIDFPQETAIGALGLYVSNESVGSFQPMSSRYFFFAFRAVSRALCPESPKQRTSSRRKEPPNTAHIPAGLPKYFILLLLILPLRSAGIYPSNGRTPPGGSSPAPRGPSSGCRARGCAENSA